MKRILVLPLLLLMAFAAFGQSTNSGSQQASSPTHSLYDFQTIDFPGAVSTFAFGLNNCGEVVGFYFDAAGTQHGFLFSNKDGFKTIDVPSAVATGLLGINDSHDIVGGWLDDSGILHGVLIHGEKLIPINFPGGVDTVAEGINNAGDIVGGYDFGDQSTNIGFVYKKGQFTSLQDPSATPSQTVALGINTEGRIVGSYTDPLGQLHGFLLLDGKYSTIDPPDALVGSEANGINSVGQSVGQYFNRSVLLSCQGYVLSHGQYQTVDFAGAAITTLQGVNDQGQLVGDYRIVLSQPAHGFIASPRKNAGR
jgi:probable HAF family extracellular repeat protein